VAGLPRNGWQLSAGIGGRFTPESLAGLGRNTQSPSKMDAEYKLSPSEGYKLVGNAVPPLLAYHVAYRLQMIWSDIFK